MEEHETLNVYFGKNFWSVQSGKPAEVFPVDLRFTVGKNKCCIPAFYLSDEGLTADILLFFDSDDVHTFLDKYAGRLDNPTPIDEWLIHAEHPIPDIDFTLRLANGKPLGENTGRSSFAHIPFLPENACENVLNDVQKAYSSCYMPDECWQCIRLHAPWLSGRPQTLTSVSLEASVHPHALPVNRRFTLQEDTATQCVVPFRHPATGEEHTLYVNEFEFLHRGPTPRLPHLPECWIPAFAYEVVPPLANDESLELLETDFSGITSDGPSSMFVVGFADSGLPGVHGEKLHAANGWMRSARGGDVHMSVLGIRSGKCNSFRYTFNL